MAAQHGSGAASASRFSLSLAASTGRLRSVRSASEPGAVSNWAA
jgi:hypothetical protein